jgi:hypothetical protein
MIPFRPDVFNVTGSREEVSIDFGHVRAADPGSGDLDVALDRRIVLAPHIAFRVAGLLGNAVRKYEETFGTLSGEVQPRRPVVDVLFDPVSGLSIEGNAEAAQRLYASVEALGIPFAFERSFKLTGRAILPNRFLCGVKRAFLGDAAGTRLPALCRKLGMPADFLVGFEADLPRADYVHFAFEEGTAGSLYKVYLEFDVGLKREHSDLREMPSEPFELHRAWKWSATGAPIRAVSRYTGFPFMTRAAILGRIEAVCGGNHPVSLAFTRRVVDLAYERLPNHGFFYMEVREDDNPRVSYDVKVYEAAIPMRALFPLADDIRRHYGIPDERFLPLYERIGDETFGHVTGGTDRGGNEFLTLYYGVAWR